MKKKLVSNFLKKELFYLIPLMINLNYHICIPLYALAISLKYLSHQANNFKKQKKSLLCNDRNIEPPKSSVRMI